MITKLSYIFLCGASLAFTQTPADANWDKAFESLIAQNPTYSSALASKRSTPEQFLKDMEEKLSAAKGTYSRSLFLALAAKASLEAGENDKAQSYASQVLALVEGRSSDLHYAYADAIFNGNFVLGRLALIGKNVDMAKAFMLRSAQIAPGRSATLDTFGPNMSLARELLGFSERAAVLQFLEECRVFWKGDAGRIDRWQAMIQKGQTPNFNEMLFR